MTPRRLVRGFSFFHCHFVLIKRVEYNVIRIIIELILFDKGLLTQCSRAILLTSAR